MKKIPLTQSEPKIENPAMKAIHRKRLEKLIAFLRQLPRKRFNFAIVRNEPPKCGAVGCAIGYTPNVFPKTLKSKPLRSVSLAGVRDGWDWTHDVAFRDGRPGGFTSVAMWITGLSCHLASNLFHPNSQMLVHPSLPELPESATPKQVARMLEKFIKLHSK